MDPVTDKAETENGSVGKRRKWAETLFYLVILIWFIILLYEAIDWGRQDQLLPMLVLIPGIFLLLFQVSKIHVSQIQSMVSMEDTNIGISPNGDQSESVEKEKKKDTSTTHLYLSIFLWVLVLPILFYFIGFFNTVPVYIFSFVYFYRRKIVESTVAAIFTTVCVYILFEYILKTRIWQGVIF